MTDDTVQADATTPAAELGEVITTSITVYTLDELDALDARDGVPPRRRERAIENMAGKLAEWWDQHEINDVSETITYILAEHLRTPGWDTFGVGDFPGIDGVKLNGWDIERGQYVLLDGRLTRENAPALPWAEGIERVDLSSHRNFTQVFVVEDDEDGPGPFSEEVGAVNQAVVDAMHAAWKAGRDQAEYLTSTEHAAEMVEMNGYRFEEDGTFHG